MTAVLPAANYASPVDAFRWGEHRSPAGGTLLRDRIPTGAAAGRFHLYGARLCPASHRLAILRAESGLADTVTMSWVHGARDARGWAFREATGADPVNGFSLLREAYLRTDPAHAGAVSVPVLWDRDADRILATDPDVIAADLLSAFGPTPLDPGPLACDVTREGRWVAANVSTVLGCAVYDAKAAQRLEGALRELDERLRGRDFLVGERLTDADVRLWVGLVRYDAGPNAHGAIGPHLDAYPDLWRYARALYARPAFRDTTEFDAFTAPYASVPDWGGGAAAGQ